MTLPAGEIEVTKISAGAVAIPLSALRSGESPRLEGVDKAHIARLAEMEAPLPPILIDRRSMQVIDGMHRILAASLKGQATIDAKFFDGSPDDAFLYAVEANVTHGLPLTQADRRAAVDRIIESHPHLSDRAIAGSAGLSARTVAGIRRRSAASQQPATRVGKDGRVRPSTLLKGRRRAAEWMTQHPQASLRVVAQAVGVSAATVADVRRRLERGEEPASVRASGGRTGSDPSALAEAQRPTPSMVLEKLLRDPSLRYNEQGRLLLLRLLRQTVVGPRERAGLIAAIPPHCTAQVVTLARQYAQTWLEFAQELEDRVKVTSKPPGHTTVKLPVPGS
jgi:hypothetical protein